MKRPVNLRREPPIYCTRTKLVAPNKTPNQPNEIGTGNGKIKKLKSWTTRELILLTRRMPRKQSSTRRPTDLQPLFFHP